MATEDIYPCYDLDDVKTRRIFVAWVLRFDDVLDTEMISAALAKLLQMGHWRKLAGQLQHRGDGRLQIRVPRHFTAEEPALTVSRENLLHLSIHEHPQGSKLHAPTEGPSIQPVTQNHPPFALRPDFPSSVEEMIRKRLPQLSLHMTSFSDATIVALAWPHTLTDAVGVLGLLKSWSLVLANREDEVPPVLGATEDVVLAAETSSSGPPVVPHSLEPRRLGGAAMVIWALRYLWYHMCSSRPESRTIFLPKATLLRVTGQIQQEAAVVSAAEGTDNFVSEGDMLSAWLTKIVSSSERAPRPITIMAFFNLRPKLSSVIDSSGVYIQNMLMTTYAFFSRHQLNGTVGSIALAHRRHLQEQTTESQTLAFMRVLRHDVKTVGDGRYLFGESDSLPIICNNLLKAEFIKAADFAPAVIRAGQRRLGTHKPGSMTVYYYRVYGTLLDRLTTFYMLGKDHDGNCWLQGNLRPEAWAKMHEALQLLE